VKLNQKNIAKLKLPPGKSDHIEWDDDLPGFGCRLRANSKPSWIVQFRVGTTTRRMKLGLLAELDATPARNAAAAILAKVRLGQDPQDEKRLSREQSADRLGPALEIYLARRERDRGLPRNRDRTLNEAIRYLRDERGAYWRPLHHMPLATITRRDIAARRAVIETQSGPTTAIQARAYLGAFFAWAMQEGLLDANPTIGVKRMPRPPRDRVLADNEIAAVWRACRDSNYGKVVKLLLLTGCRREEIGGLQWQEIDFDADMITLPPKRVKNNRRHVIPLSATARKIIESIIPRAGVATLFGRDGFTSWVTEKKALDHRIAETRGENLKAWRLHDLRRSVATGMAKLGIELPTIEKVLNHQSGSFGGIVGVYQHHDFLVEKRRALQIWADHITALVEQRPRTITPLKRA
jgi:integrase